MSHETNQGTTATNQQQQVRLHLPGARSSLASTRTRESVRIPVRTEVDTLRSMLARAISACGTPALLQVDLCTQLDLG